MILLPETPTFPEWLALLHGDPEQAQAIVAALRKQRQDFSILIGPEALLSLEDFDRAQQLLMSAATDPAYQQRVAEQIRLGRATMAPPPDLADWQRFIETDAGFARRLYNAFELKRVMLGCATPRAMIVSLEAYRKLTEQEHDRP